MVRFGVEFVPRDVFWKTVYYAVQAERSGFDFVWVTDHFNNRNVYVTLATVALYTDRIIFGPGVTNPFLIHPVATASAVASLNEMAPGRVVCGIGAGDRTTLDLVGVSAAKPLAAVGEAVQIMQGLFAGETVEFKGEVFQVLRARLNFKPKERVPIYIGAQGARMLTLAASIGDGVLINASHPRDFEEASAHIKAGVSKAGRDLSALDVAAYTCFSIDEDLKKAVKAAVPIVAVIVGGSPEAVLGRHGIKPEVGVGIRDALAKERWGDALSMVTPDLIDAFSICGTPDTCIEKINEVLKMGVTQFVVGSPIGPDVRKAIGVVSNKVTPHFKEAA